jgi:outer membrane lipoprotein-sorting protein
MQTRNSCMRNYLKPAILLLLGWGGLGCAAQELDSAVSRWLAAQTNLQTWAADFTQTRTFKTLTQPLQETGRVWFARPNRFRWELGAPAKTIAVRGTNELQIIYPRLKRAERFSLNTSDHSQWRDALALLDAGFPENETQLRTQYNLLSQAAANATGELMLEPKNANARRLIPKILIQFAIQDLSLKATELRFGDGSTLRNDFRNPVLNPPLDAELFSPAIPFDFSIREPLKR